MTTKPPKQCFKIGLAKDGWYVTVPRTLKYLHNDGVWRTSTQSDEGWTGYYPTRDAVEAALEAWKKSAVPA